MNLLVVSTWWPCPPDNGSRMRAYQLVRRLAARHRVTLLAFGDGAPHELRAPLDAVCAEVHLVPRPRPGARLRLKGLLSPVPRSFAQARSDAMRALVDAKAAGQDAALALQIDAATHLTHRTDLPKVFEEVEISVLRGRAAGASTVAGRVRHGLTWLKHQAFVRDVVERFDGATVVSTLERDALGAIGCDIARVSVVPNAVDVAADAPPAVRSEQVIYPGSVQYDANLDAVRYFVTEVLPIVRRRRPHLRVCVTGDTTGVDLRGLDAPGVTFTGRIASLDDAIRASAACIVPLRIGGGTRLKVLQAMALGTPVVSTSKGIEGLDVIPGLHCAVGDTAGAFAARLLGVLDGPRDADQMAGRARTLVRERYRWDASLDELEGALNTAIARFDAHPNRARRRVCAAV